MHLRKPSSLLKPLPLFFFCFCAQELFAQRQVVARPAIEKAIAGNQLDEAEALVKKEVDFYWASRLTDSLNHYIFYTGKIEQLKTGTDKAVKKVEALVEKIKTISASPSTLRQTYIEAGEYFGFAGKANLAYKADQQALKYTLAMPGKTPAQLGMVESNLGTYAQRMGDINLAAQHQRQALRYRQSDPNTDAESLYISYNNMGSILWYASKLDSAVLFFNKALETLKKTEPTPVNQYYRPALVLNNVSGIYSLQGKPTEAIHALKTCILNLKTFIAGKEPHLKKNSALSLQFEATDNLAGIYKELGNYAQARDLLLHSYEQKKAALDKSDPGIFTSQILLGQLYYAVKDYDKALRFLNEGLEGISREEGGNALLKADACQTLAMLHEEQKNKAQAALFYKKADALYEESLAGEYDNIYLEFVGHAALFYAAAGEGKTALAKAGKAYGYVAKTKGAGTLSASYQLLNLSEVHYLLGNYAEALAYGNRSLAAVNKAMLSSNNLLDSVKMELKKPKAILQKTKAEYALLKTKTTKDISPLLSELTGALAILERRKTVLNNADDIGLLMADQSDLVKFIEKLNVDLYKLTNDGSYLKKLIGLHESAMYNRIRARLDKTDSLPFAHLPASVQTRERLLKTALAGSLEGSGSHDQKIGAYFAAEEAWKAFQESLKKDYPRYYEMRYASIFKSVDDVRQRVPAATTVVRYFFSDGQLFALVADVAHEVMLPLATHDLDKHMAALSAAPYDVAKTGEALNELYNQLWKPITGAITNKNVVIVPDGILYNLSFETLTPKRISSFKDLATAGLLATHNISYHYSLFLLGQKKALPSGTASFVAFAPGFTDKLKQPYKTAAGAAAVPDEHYLSLLPQPFTVDLAAGTQKLLGGDVFLYEQSTAGSFRQNAANHKIIHIGTHAESDNLHPEFSRLIFAKSGAGADEDNSLYLPQLYNCNLTADLAVLTACESGRPGYEDGEGMISLAHAFNYAGSESILTGLWKIDEKATAVLLEEFYKNLLAGLPKDEALRRAKLAYLKTADGRALSPQYWAGLVVMGDTSPIVLEPKEEAARRWMVTGGFLLLLAAGAFFFLRKKKTPANENGRSLL